MAYTVFRDPRSEKEVCILSCPQRGLKMEGVVLRGVKNSTALVLTSYMEKKKLSCLVKLAYREFSACIRKLRLIGFVRNCHVIRPCLQTDSVTISQNVWKGVYLGVRAWWDFLRFVRYCFAVSCCLKSFVSFVLHQHFTDSYTEVKAAERTARPSRLCFFYSFCHTRGVPWFRRSHPATYRLLVHNKVNHMLHCLYSFIYEQTSSHNRQPFIRKDLFFKNHFSHFDDQTLRHSNSLISVRKSNHTNNSGRGNIVTSKR